jgi:hypothetical protein
MTGGLDVDESPPATRLGIIRKNDFDRYLVDW